MAARKILCVTLEPISQQMAGPAIRAFELARQLSSDFGVTLFSPRPSDLPRDPSWPANLQLATGLSRSRLYAIADECEIIYLQANVLKPYPGLARRGKHLVLDLYDPYLLSLLAQYADDPLSSSASYRLMHQVLEQHMIAADFSICASERQRDYWLGRYCAIGRLTPEMYRFDPSFRKLIDVVPFGLPSEAPRRTGPGLKGNVPGIAGGDQVLLWGGGIWQWFDPVTVIEAVARLARTRPNIKLFFMGWRSPNPQVPLMEMSVRARQHARQLGVLDSRVIFHDSWVPYEQRVNYLLDADIAAWVGAISRLLDDRALNQKLREGSRKLAGDFVWSRAAEPLRRFCENPHHLPPFARVKMPSLVERAQAVYARGGRDMLVKRSKEVLDDLLRK